jgi:hypothetical protein
MGGFATDEQGFSAQINDLWKYDIAVATGIRDQNPRGGFYIFPNPTSGIITVTSNNNENNSEYIISDLTGKIVSEGLIYGESSQIDISYLQEGIYFLQLGKNKSESFKISKR